MVKEGYLGRLFLIGYYRTWRMYVSIDWMEAAEVSPQAVMCRIGLWLRSIKKRKEKWGKKPINFATK
jgi:hypothetical protein